MREYPNWVLLLGRLALFALLAAPVLIFGWYTYGRTGVLIALVFSAPILGKLITKPLIELTHEGFGWLWHQPLAAWEGNYYAFDNVHVRVYEVDDGLWFAIADVLKATGMKRVPATFLSTHARDVRRVPGTTLSATGLAGVEALLAANRDPKAGRFILWARREVVQPWERRTGREKRRFEAKR